MYVTGPGWLRLIRFLSCGYLSEQDLDRLMNCLLPVSCKDRVHCPSNCLQGIQKGRSTLALSLSA